MMAALQEQCLLVLRGLQQIQNPGKARDDSRIKLCQNRICNRARIKALACTDSAEQQNADIFLLHLRPLRRVPAADFRNICRVPVINIEGLPQAIRDLQLIRCPGLLHRCHKLLAPVFLLH